MRPLDDLAESFKRGRSSTKRSLDHLTDVVKSLRYSIRQGAGIQRDSNQWDAMNSPDTQRTDYEGIGSATRRAAKAAAKNLSKPTSTRRYRAAHAGERSLNASDKLSELLPPGLKEDVKGVVNLHRTLSDSTLLAQRQHPRSFPIDMDRWRPGSNYSGDTMYTQRTATPAPSVFGRLCNPKKFSGYYKRRFSDLLANENTEREQKRSPAELGVKRLLSRRKDRTARESFQRSLRPNLYKLSEL